MQLQALDGPIYYLFLVIGLVFAIAGLTFIFRGKADENAARIEMFGMKFQSSSAGTLVFLIGVAFLLIPLFVPKAETGEVAAKPPSAEAQDQTTGTAQAPGDLRALVLPQTADAEEAEPNDTITQANQFALGFGAKGSIDRDRDDFWDWYLIDTSSALGKDLIVQIRSPRGWCKVAAFDSQEQPIDKVDCDHNGGSGRFSFFNKEDDLVYLRVEIWGVAQRTEYELFLKEQ